MPATAANPQPNGIIIGAGAQILTAERTPLAAQNPGLPTPVGSFNITQLGLKADKIGKDTNFRGLTVFNNVIYVTKGSGGNGINTVYFIDTTGFDANGKPLACPNGVGLPGATATLPAAPIFYDATKLQTLGVVPYNMCILKGFPTTLAKTATSFPFGVWFADAKTLYVADEGDGTNTFDPASGKYTAAAAQTGGGTAEVGVRLQPRRVETRLRAAGRAEPRRALYGRRLSDRAKSQDRPAVGARRRRPSQHHRPRQSRWHRDDLGHHLDRQRKRRPGR